MTVHECVASARARLRSAGLGAADAALDARLLAQHALGWDSARFLTEADHQADASFLRIYEAAVSRRAAREPLAYIVGHREFWNLAFEVAPGVLVPRPETECIIEAALELAPEAPLTLCDVGTGSGCIAVALAHERPAARIVGTDVSSTALAVAARNAAAHGVADRIELVGADVFADARGPFHLIVSNPPYVPEADRDRLQPEVGHYEPAGALFGGPDGLSIIRRLVAAAPSHLCEGGSLIFEIGAGQAERVEALIWSTGKLKMTGVRADLQGIPRVVVAQRA